MTSSAASPSPSIATESPVAKAVVLGLLTVVLFLAAWNRGDPMVYGLFALLAAVLVLGYALPLAGVARITGSRALPAEASEGETIEAIVEIANRGWLARHMIEISDRVPAAGAAGGAVQGYIARLAGGARYRQSLSFECVKRGVYPIGPLKVRSAFPLGLFGVEKMLDLRVLQLVVYPTPVPIPRFLPQSASLEPSLGMETAARAGGTTDFFGVREYRPGDSPRYIHWPSSARHGELIVKEFELVTAPALAAVLDLAPDASVGEGRENTLEYAVKLAISAARWAADRGVAFALHAEGVQTLHLESSRGAAHFAAIREALARVSTGGDASYPDAVGRAAARVRAETAVMLFVCRPHRVAEAQASIAAARARGLRPHVFVMDREAFAAGRSEPSDGATALAARIAAEGVWARVVAPGTPLGPLFA